MSDLTVSAPRVLSRRQFLKAGLALVTAGASPALVRAQSAGDLLLLTVVELANFYCSRCYAVNAFFGDMQRVSYDAQIDLLFAPMSWNDQSEWPTRVYYAARDVYPRLEPLVRDGIFAGIHQDGLPFESLSQVGAYLDRQGIFEQARVQYPDFDWMRIATVADSDEPMYAQARAVRLVEVSGIEEVPAFLWIGDSRVIRVLAADQLPEPRALSTQILNQLRSDRDQRARPAARPLADRIFRPMGQ